MYETRKIIHIDMDAFYAAVEVRDRPELRGKPLVVGGSPFSRGVVATASYEARRFGIRSAMPTFHAYKLCPQAIFVQPRFERYREISEHIHTIYRDFTSCIEPLSLDEAYLDVTKADTTATRIAQMIRQRIFTELGLTASAGVSINKLAAKVASEFQKPNGLTVVLPHQVKEFIGRHEVRKIPGVGPKTEEQLHAKGIKLCSDAWIYTEEDFSEWFGKWGGDLWRRFQGIDERVVETERVRKSYGREQTFAKDLFCINEAREIYRAMVNETFHHLCEESLQARTLTLKVKYSDFTQIVRSQTVKEPFSHIDAVMNVVETLMTKTEVGARPVRLLGVSFKL